LSVAWKVFDAETVAKAASRIGNPKIRDHKRHASRRAVDRYACLSGCHRTRSARRRANRLARMPDGLNRRPARSARHRYRYLCRAAGYNRQGLRLGLHRRLNGGANRRSDGAWRRNCLGIADGADRWVRIHIAGIAQPGHGGRDHQENGLAPSYHAFARFRPNRFRE
jgi:hypothetical protein